MALRWKAYAPNTILKSVEVQDLADNGVVQLDTAADLASADLVNANVTYVVAEAKPYVRTAPGVGADKWTVFSAGAADFSNAATGTYTDQGVDYKFLTFDTSGTLTVTRAGFADVLVVGGGGGGGRMDGSGGGAGGHLYATDVYLPAQPLTIRVGAGGVGGDSPSARRPSGVSGNASAIGDYVVAPGGGGGGGFQLSGHNGGSGGGGYPAGSGFSPQGNAGGAGGNLAGGGGGGADADGQAGSGTPNGGAGKANSITGTSVTRAGGGGGGAEPGGAAGAGGVGGGGSGNVGSNTTAESGTVNTGSGGGGGGFASGDGAAGGAGGSGIVIIRVKV